MENAEGTKPNFTRQELEEIKKWAEVIGYQGNARELEKALEVNRGIVEKCEARVERLTKEGAQREGES